MKPRPIYQIVAAGVLFAALPLLPFNGIPAISFGLRPDRFLVLFAGFCLCLPLLWKPSVGKRVAELLGCAEELLPPPEPRFPLAWPAFGFIFVAALLAFLEIRQPYYFTQDDNAVQFLPVILQACREAFRGVFPNWNPYQLLGAPTASLGTYALTYPATYISYAVARFLLGNEFLTLEVFAVLHLLAGFVAVYWAARSFGVRPSLSMLVSVCAILSGFALIASRSWYYMSPVFVWVPLMMAGMGRLPGTRSGLRWIAGMGCVIGVFFHAGNVQMWSYAVIFLGIATALLLYGRVIDWRRALHVALAGLLGLALSAMLLLPQFMATRDALRTAPMMMGSVEPHLLPFLFFGAWLRVPGWYWGGAEVVYSGTLFVVVSLLAVLTAIPFRWGRAAIVRNFWLICALIAVLCVLGRNGVLWPLQLHLPLLNKFRLPFKFLAFFNLFVGVGGAMILERLLRRSRRARLWEAALVVLTCGLMVVHCVLTSTSFYHYCVPPYPALGDKVESVLKQAGTDYRLAAIVPLRSPAADYWRGLPHNLASIYRLHDLDGYDPLVQLEPGAHRRQLLIEGLSRQALPEYGVRFVLVHRVAHQPEFSDDPGANWMENYLTMAPNVEKAALSSGRLVYEDQSLKILELPEARPLAFAEKSPQTPLPLQVDGSGASIAVSGLATGAPIVLNLQWRPEIQAYVNGHLVRTDQDAWGRITFRLPAAATAVRVRYAPPWGSGALAGLVLLGTWVLAVRFAMRKGWIARAASSFTVTQPPTRPLAGANPSAVSASAPSEPALSGK